MALESLLAPVRWADEQVLRQHTRFDGDPKLLEKEPFWKRVYHWAREKVRSLAPEPTPQPQPVPVRSYITLDDYVQVRVQ
jgi:hypothetical protein